VREIHQHVTLQIRGLGLRVQPNGFARQELRLDELAARGKHQRFRRSSISP
jgi:hypothetical protein